MAAKHHVTYLKRKVNLTNMQHQAVIRASPPADGSIIARYARAAKHWDRELQTRIDIMNRRTPVDKRANH